MPRGRYSAIIAIVSAVLMTASVATAHGRLATARVVHSATTTSFHKAHQLRLVHAQRAAVAVKHFATATADPVTTPPVEPPPVVQPPPVTTPCVESDDTESDDNESGDSEDGGTTQGDDTESGDVTPPTDESSCDDQNEHNDEGEMDSTDSSESDDSSSDSSDSSGD